MLPEPTGSGDLPSADKVHDLQPIAFYQFSARPLVPRDNIPIQFNRDPVRLHAQLFDQSLQRKRVFKRAIFPIDNEFHPC